MTPKKTWFLFLTFAFFFSCGRTQAPVEVDRIQEDGVEVVLNHLRPYRLSGQSSELFIEKEFAVDAERPDLLERGLTDILRFDVDSYGLIYLMQPPRQNEDLIFKLDGTGQVLGSFGPCGAGPGEIQWPFHFGINSLNEILVFDTGGNKLVAYDSSGGVIREIPLRKAQRGGIPLENGNFLSTDTEERSLEQFREISLSIYGPEFDKVRIFSSFRFPADPELAGKINVYTPYPLLAVTRERIYLGYLGPDYEILAYDLEGAMIRKIRKEYHPEPVTDDFKKQTLSRAPKGNPIIERLYFPPDKPAFQYLFTDEFERLFVMTFETDKSSGQNICDVFTKDGIFICRAPIGYLDIVRSFWEGLRLDVTAKNGRFYALREKEDGFKELVVSKALWR